MISSNLDGIFALANGRKSIGKWAYVLEYMFFRSPLLGIWENVTCARHSAPFRADLDHDAQVMQKGETGYAVYKGHDFGTGIEAVLVQVPRL